MTNSQQISPSQPKMLHIQSAPNATLGLLARLIVVVLACSGLLCSAATLEKSPSSSNANKEFARLCDEKLAELKNGQGLSSEKVTDSFEQALENIAKSNDYIEQIRASAKPETIEEYDRNGGLFVLKISDKRREFLAAFRETTSEDERLQLLESNYVMACGFEKTTEMSLKAMQKSAKIKAAAQGG